MIRYGISSLSRTTPDVMTNSQCVVSGDMLSVQIVSNFLGLVGFLFSVIKGFNPLQSLFSLDFSF